MGDTRFSLDQNDHDMSLRTCHLHLLWSAIYSEKPHGMLRSWSQFVCVCFHLCGVKDPNTTHWRSIADNVITHCGLGSPFYISVVCTQVGGSILDLTFVCTYHTSLLRVCVYVLQDIVHPPVFNTSTILH